MKITVRGFRNLDFISDGQKVCGTQIFVSYPEDGVTGEMTDKIFIREGAIALPSLKEGMLLDITYNRKGRPQSISAVPTSKGLNLGQQ